MNILLIRDPSFVSQSCLFNFVLHFQFSFKFYIDLLFLVLQNICRISIYCTRLKCKHVFHNTSILGFQSIYGFKASQNDLRCEYRLFYNLGDWGYTSFIRCYMFCQNLFCQLLFLAFTINSIP
jgi:hypothetical protein